jgi:hypothetical protein
LTISCYDSLGFNNTWNATTSSKPSFVEVCENFVKKESLAQMTLREDAMAVGGNAADLNTSRTKTRVHLRQDLIALCKDFDNARTKDYLHYMVSTFSFD